MYTNVTCWCGPSECALASVKRAWEVYRGRVSRVMDDWWVVFLVKSVRVVRGCRVRFVPRWKRGRWKALV